MTRLWLGIVCAGALAIRLTVMWIIPPGIGDAAGSYCYRATMLIAGQWDALWALWHPPGFAVLIAAASVATAQVMSPWWTGNAINLAAAAGLLLAADRLLAPRVTHARTRLGCAALLACSNSLIQWQSSPLSEAVFLLLGLLALVAFDRDQILRRHALLAGLLAGAASTLRFEGAMLTAGLFLYLAWRNRSVGDALALAAGWVIAAGWMYVRWDFLMQSLERHREVTGRAPEAIDLSIIPRWLGGLFPVLCWPFIATAVWRLSRAGGPPAGRRLNLLFLAALVPVLTFVALTEPHERTGIILVVPAMIWVAVALDSARAPVTYGIVVFLCAIGLARVTGDVRRATEERDVVREEARVLRSQSAPPGKIWAFGDERPLYGIFGWPVPYDFWNRAAVDGPVLGDRSTPDFIAALRERGYRYLMFDLPPGSSERVNEGYWPLLQPRRSMLSAIAAEPDRFRLRSMGAPAPLQAFEILP